MSDQFNSPRVGGYLRVELERIPDPRGDVSKDEDPTWFRWCRERGVVACWGPRRGYWQDLNTHIHDAQWAVYWDGRPITLLNEEEARNLLRDEQGWLGPPSSDR